MRIGRHIFSAVILAAAIMLTGCGVKSEMIEEALELTQKQDYDGSLIMLDEAEQSGEDAQLIARARGINCVGLTRYEDAAGYFQEALDLANGKVTDLELDVSYYLAVAQYKSGRYEDAAQTYTAILGMKPGDAGTYYLRGAAYIENDQKEEALRDLNLAIENDVKNPDLYIKIFELLDRKGYNAEGLDFLSRAVNLDTKFTDFQKGKLHYYQGDYESARSFLEKARGTDEGVTLYLGRTYEALGDVNYAASLYKTYLEKVPEDVEVLNQLGLCQMAAGDYDNALQSFEKGLAVEGNAIVQTLKFNEIVAYEYKKDFKKAAVLMKSYLELYPDDGAAIRENNFLKTR